MSVIVVFLRPLGLRLFESDPACNYVPKVLREDPKYFEELRKNPMGKKQ